MNKIRVAVVGLGAVGCATMLALARRGYDVVGYEQFRVGNNIGASGGQTRQHRLIYGESSLYTPLLQRAKILWQQLEKEQQQQLFYPGGFLTIGTAESPWFQAVEHSAKKQALSYQRLSREELRQRFPRLNVDEDEEGLFDPEGGILLTHELLLASAEQAKKLGATIHEDTQITEISSTASGASVSIDGQTLYFDHVVVASGAWSKKLLPQLSITSRRLGKSFHIGKQSGFDSQSFPPTMRVTAGRPMWNTQPLPDGKTFKFFIGDAEFNEENDPQLIATDADAALTPTLYQRLDRYLPQAVNGAHQTIIGGGTWPEAYTRDQAPIVGYSQSHPRLWMGLGLSGHGFKLAPALGELLAQAIDKKIDLTTTWPTFSPDRHFAEPQAVYSR